MRIYQNRPISSSLHRRDQGRNRQTLFLLTVIILFAGAGLFLRGLPALAQEATAPLAEPLKISQDFHTLAREAILIDQLSGQVLFEKNADARQPPASMTKMMTIYLLFDRLQRKVLSLDDEFTVSEEAWRKGGSKMFVEVNKRVRIEDLIRGIIVQSGNDATIVVAEGLAGSEEAFAELMTAKARELGLTNTNFMNASGWPDPDQYSSARDLALIANALTTHFPDFYHYFSEREFTYNGIRQFNRNPLLRRVNGVDGLKTGHVEASGYGVTISAERAGRRLTLVVHGLESSEDRRTEAERLLEWGFKQWGYYQFYGAGDQVTTMPIWLGNNPSVDLVVDRPVALNLPRAQRENLRFYVTGEGPATAPVEQGAPLARLELRIDEQPIATYPLIASNAVAKLGPFARIWAAFSHLLFGESS